MNPENVKSLNDLQLIERTEYLVRRERQVIECLIWHLQEIQDRRLYIKMGYTDMFECLVKHFKYSETVAYARKASLKIIKEVPMITEALSSGELNLTNLSLAQTFFKKQEKKNEHPVTTEQKIDLIENIKNKTTHEVKQLLAELSPEMNLPVDQVKYLSFEKVQIQMTVDKNLLDKINYLKSLISHENINPNYNDLLGMALDAAIEKKEKKKGLFTQKQIAKECNLPEVNSEKPLRKTSEPLTQGFVVRENSRYISRKVKKIVFNKANHQCEFIHPDGSRCNSTFQLQFDHIKAFSRGGSSSQDNIQLLCRVHNSSKSNK